MDARALFDFAGKPAPAENAPQDATVPAKEASLVESKPNADEHIGSLGAKTCSLFDMPLEWLFKDAAPPSEASSYAAATDTDCTSSQPSSQDSFVDSFSRGAAMRPADDLSTGDFGESPPAKRPKYDAGVANAGKFAKPAPPVKTAPCTTFNPVHAAAYPKMGTCHNCGQPGHWARDCKLILSKMTAGRDGKCALCSKSIQTGVDIIAKLGTGPFIYNWVHRSCALPHLAKLGAF